MQLDITPSHADFLYGDLRAGRYCYRDAFKPHVHPLRTPRGHSVTVRSPHDHVHHKALMYALRTPVVNFWEERTTPEDGTAGIQRHVEFRDVVSSGVEVGFVESLDWISSGDGATWFSEVRTIRCRPSDDRQGFTWTWHTRLTVERDTTLIQSQWSHKHADGRRTNYHGLGIRMRRDFGGNTGGYQLVLDGQRLESNDFTAAMAAAPREVTYVGSIDETWPVERASVTFVQQHGHRNALFAFNTAFAFMALGPSNASELAVKRGQVLDEQYEVIVRDV